MSPAIFEKKGSSRMGLVRCPNGHMFSGRKYGTICPYCFMETKKKEKIKPPSEDWNPETELLEEVIEPVCGWMVCIDGARVGMDYKIRTGKNFIGRDDEMDVQILGDNKISRKNHAIIVYDSKKRNVVLLPGDASGIAYLNEEAVYVPTELSAYDLIELGNSRFLFVPFCGDNFEWEEKP